MFCEPRFRNGSQRLNIRVCNQEHNESLEGEIGAVDFIGLEVPASKDPHRHVGAGGCIDLFAEIRVPERLAGIFAGPDPGQTGGGGLPVADGKLSAAAKMSAGAVAPPQLSAFAADSVFLAKRGLGHVVHYPNFAHQVDDVGTVADELHRRGQVEAKHDLSEAAVRIDFKQRADIGQRGRAVRFAAAYWLFIW